MEIVARIDTRDCDKGDILLALFNPLPFARDEVVPVALDLPTIPDSRSTQKAFDRLRRGTLRRGCRPNLEQIPFPGRGRPHEGGVAAWFRVCFAATQERLARGTTNRERRSQKFAGPVKHSAHAVALFSQRRGTCEALNPDRR